MAAYDLRHYDGVLAFGSIIRDRYLQKGWTQRAWTWHEAADTRLEAKNAMFMRL
jgi:spore maturation protein CgeB